MPITIKVPPEVELRLTALADQTDRDVDFYLLEVVRRGLKAVEYHYLAGGQLHSNAQEKWTIVRRADEQCE